MGFLKFTSLVMLHIHIYVYMTLKILFLNQAKHRHLEIHIVHHIKTNRKKEGKKQCHSKDNSSVHLPVYLLEGNTYSCLENRKKNPVLLLSLLFLPQDKLQGPFSVVAVVCSQSFSLHYQAM